LSARIQSENEVLRRSNSFEAARRAESIAEVRYRAGKSSLKDWLDFQAMRQEASLRLNEAVYLQYANQIALYLALGGDPWAQDSLSRPASDRVSD
jgi:outer membrane protein TolC